MLYLSFFEGCCFVFGFGYLCLLRVLFGLFLLVFEVVALSCLFIYWFWVLCLVILLWCCLFICVFSCLMVMVCCGLLLQVFGLMGLDLGLLWVGLLVNGWMCVRACWLCFSDKLLFCLFVVCMFW